MGDGDGASATKDLEFFIRLECGVWEALRDGDAAADGGLLSEDFVGVYPTGFAVRADHVGQLDDGPTVADYEVSEARLIEVTPDDMLLSYRADFRRIDVNGTRPTEAMYVSSLWSRRDDRWLNTFSQDTPTADANAERSKFL